MKRCAENEYIETLKPVLYVLKLLGILPFILTEKRTCHQKISTLLMNVLSMIIYSIASGSSVIFISNNIVRLTKHFSLTHFVRANTEILLRVYVLMLPFVLWTKSSLFTQYCNRWKSLQNDVELMSGTPYKCPAKRTVKWIVYSQLSFFIMNSFIYSYLGRTTSLSHRLSMVLILSFSNFTLVYWYSNCIFTRHVLYVIREQIETAMNKGSKNNENLEKIAIMWIQVCDLVDSFNSIHSISFLAQTVTGVISGISCIYSAILSYLSPGKDGLLAGDVLSFTIGVSVTYMYCESANTLYNCLVNSVKEMLLNKSTSKMPTTCLQTLSLFLNAIEVRNPKVQLNGVMVIDRSRFIAILGGGINYLIILAQFGSVIYEK